MTLIFCYFLYLKRKIFLEIFTIFIWLLFLIISIFSPRIGDYDKSIDVLWWNVLFISDVSTSMNVEDISANKNKTTRLQATKQIIQSYVNTHQNNKYGLYAFAWDALEILPFTSDYWLFKTILNGVDEKNIPVKWSNFTKLFSWLQSYISYIDEPTTFVIFSDAGEIENIKIPSTLQKKLEEKSIQIVFVAVWTNKWWMILDGVDFYGRATFKMYNWEPVVSQLNKSEVKKICDEYNWDYVFFESLDDESKIHDIINDNLIQSNLQLNISQAKDISYIFVGLFLLFFTLFLFLEKRKF